jgi:hypothetical protein
MADTSASSPTRLPGPLSDRVAGVMALLPASAASWAVLVFTVGTTLAAGLQRHLYPTQGPQRLVELDLGEAFAIAAVLSLLLPRPHEPLTLTRGDRAVFGLCALSWFLPEPHAVYLGMTLAGAWLILRQPRPGPLRQVGQIWLALSLCELWSKLVFKMFYLVIEPVEVAVLAWVGRMVFPALQTEGVYLSIRPDWSVVMLEGCSAFHNLSLAALIWLCLLAMAGRRVDRGTLLALAASAGLVVAVNIARILAMLPSQDAYLYWHDGTGSVLVALAAVVASVGPMIVQIERAA